MPPALRVILRPQVPDDLEAIMIHLERAGGHALANAFLAAAFDTFDDLASMPGKGSPKEFGGVPEGYVRSWWIPGFRSYLTYYRSTDDTLVVLAVLHGSRNVAEVLRDRR